eukprot:gene15150-20407_t
MQKLITKNVIVASIHRKSNRLISHSALNVQYFNAIKFQKFTRMISVLPKEPAFAVGTSEYVEPDEVKVPWINEETRKEMYNKYESDPVTWSIKNLALHYSASLVRVKAIVYLMEKRKKLMEQRGLPGGVIPNQWSNIYEKYTANPTTPLSEIAEYYELTVQEVEKIIENISLHNLGLHNVNLYQTKMEERLEELKEEGVDIKHQETPNSVGIASFSTVEDNYHPPLFGDDDFEYEKKKLFDRLTKESKATLEKDVDYYVYNYGLNDNNNSKIAPGETQQVPNQSSLGQVRSNSSDPNKISRWKYAFKDMSTKTSTTMSYGKSNAITSPEIDQSSSSNPNNLDTEMRKRKPRTVILTRSGKLRNASALEEATRSWNTHPDPFDLQFKENRIKLIKQQLIFRGEDPNIEITDEMIANVNIFDLDGDDDKAKQLVVDELVRRKALKSANGKK